MTDVIISGPLFDGTADTVMRLGTQAVREKLTDTAERRVHAVFAGMIRDDKGVFLSQVTSTDVSTVYSSGSTWTRDGQRVSRVYTMPITVADPAVETIVTTENATYGPWLEGTGSRNETTRFKGYHGYRLTAQELDGEAQGIADEVLQPYIERCR